MSILDKIQDKVEELHFNGISADLVLLSADNYEAIKNELITIVGIHTYSDTNNINEFINILHSKIRIVKCNEQNYLEVYSLGTSLYS